MNRRRRKPKFPDGNPCDSCRKTMTKDCRRVCERYFEWRALARRARETITTINDVDHS